MVRFIKAIPLLLVIILLAGIASVASAQSQECEAGSAVTDAVNNPGLLADCDVLLAARDTLQGDATLNWSADLAIDRWDGVGLSGSPQRVTSLQFYGGYNQRLTGTIPAELGSLTNLQSLTLSNNYLTGTIPAELGSLTNLQSLTLYDNYLTGPIPSELGGLASLQSLTLSDNYLTGSIPPELGGLASLFSLDLADNYLRGPIPAELGSLTNLEWLNLSWNQLSGPIPTELGSLSNLNSLQLSENQLSGTIPAELGSLTNLEWLGLSGNQLSGTIPAELGSLTNLEWLGLSGNQLSGTIPAELGSLTNLEWLGLSGNQLSGTIPSWLGSFTNLSSLGLSGNQLSGTMPAELGSLTNLVWLGLSGNQLSGTIPSWLGSLSSLSELGLSGNQLSGTMPAELGSLTNLVWLDLSGNQLSGTMPAELGSLTNLVWLDLSGNQLSGTIPSWLGTLANLHSLELSGNQLTGCIPHGLRIVKGLDGLSLDFCPDPGTPTTTPPPLGDCTTGGAVTDAAANPGLVADCTALLAARDTLAGTAALNWSADLAIDSWDGVDLSGSPQRVTSLNFYDQRLTGKIPEQLGSLTYLKNLRLDYGHLLTGPIPAEMGSLTYLKSLDLGDNRLSGTIPAEMARLTYLKSLTLYDNYLSGTIPAELGSLVNLKSLALFGNRLTGPLPQSFTNLTALGEFFFQANAGLCAPTDAAFQNWLQGIVNSGGPNCSVSSLGAPAIGAVTPGTGSLAISWTAPSSDGSSAITAYDLRHIETAADETMDANWTVVKDVWTGSGPLRYVLTGLTGGTQYGVQMRAANSIGDGPWSATATGTPQSAPSSPANQRYSWEGSTTVLSWDAVADADYYKIYYDDSFSSSCRLSSSGSSSFCEELAANVQGTSYTHTSPDDDDNYYWVTACNIGGCSEIDSENPASLEGSAPAPDLVVDNATVSDSAPAAGGSFTLSAVVRNQGNGSSDSTTLRYYRSTDSTITSGDTEVGTDSVSSLHASESSPQTISLTAPSTLGTYYYGACVDAVDGEANTSNDCSDGVKVTVVAVSSGDPLVARYDANGDGAIDIGELFSAIDDYFDGAIGIGELFAIIDLYFSGPTPTATAQPPGAPTGLTATANGPTGIDLSWSGPANNVGAAFTGYRLEDSNHGSP